MVRIAKMAEDVSMTKSAEVAGKSKVARLPKNDRKGQLAEMAKMDNLPNVANLT